MERTSRIEAHTHGNTRSMQSNIPGVCPDQHSDFHMDGCKNGSLSRTVSGKLSLIPQRRTVQRSRTVKHSGSMAEWIIVVTYPLTVPSCADHLTWLWWPPSSLQRRSRSYNTPKSQPSCLAHRVVPDDVCSRPLPLPQRRGRPACEILEVAPKGRHQYEAIPWLNGTNKGFSAVVQPRDSSASSSPAGSNGKPTPLLLGSVGGFILLSFCCCFHFSSSYAMITLSNSGIAKSFRY